MSRLFDFSKRGLSIIPLLCCMGLLMTACHHAPIKDGQQKVLGARITQLKQEYVKAKEAVTLQVTPETLHDYDKAVDELAKSALQKAYGNKDIFQQLGFYQLAYDSKKHQILVIAATNKAFNDTLLGVNAKLFRLNQDNQFSAIAEFNTPIFGVTESPLQLKDGGELLAFTSIHKNKGGVYLLRLSPDKELVGDPLLITESGLNAPILETEKHPDVVWRAHSAKFVQSSGALYASYSQYENAKVHTLVRFVPNRRGNYAIDDKFNSLEEGKPKDVWQGSDGALLSVSKDDRVILVEGDVDNQNKSSHLEQFLLGKKGYYQVSALRKIDHTGKTIKTGAINYIKGFSSGKKNYLMGTSLADNYTYIFEKFGRTIRVVNKIKTGPALGLQIDKKNKLALLSISGEQPGLAIINLKNIQHPKVKKIVFTDYKPNKLILTGQEDVYLTLKSPQHVDKFIHLKGLSSWKDLASQCRYQDWTMGIELVDKDFKPISRPCTFAK